MTKWIQTNETARRLQMQVYDTTMKINSENSYSILVQLHNNLEVITDEFSSALEGLPSEAKQMDSSGWLMPWEREYGVVAENER